MGLMKNIAIDIANGDHKHTYPHADGKLRIDNKGRVTCWSCGQKVSNQEYKQDCIFLRNGL